MDFDSRTPKPQVLLLPVAGMGLFLFFYILAAMNYPGGSYALPNQKGFSFWNNYLCDLLDSYAINGEPNSSRSFAALALLILCISLILLWFYLPRLFPVKSINQRIMCVAGIASLGVVFLLPFGEHDVIVKIAGCIGVLALITSFVELYKIGYYKLLLWGIFCLIIFLVNYYVYETGSFIHALPVIQKITFLGCISWFILLDISIYKKLKSSGREGA